MLVFLSRIITKDIPGWSVFIRIYLPFPENRRKVCKGLQNINEWLGQLTDLAKTLVVIGIIVGILFDDFFGVIAGLGRIMSQFGDAGFAGILSLAILVMWYERK